MVFKDAADRELAEQDYQEYSLELEWEQALIEAWEAMQPPVEDNELENTELEPF
jgi:hypothetical protein